MPLDIAGFTVASLNPAVPWELVSWIAYTPDKKKEQTAFPPTHVICDSTGLQHVETESWGAMRYASTIVTWSQAAPIVTTSRVRSATQRVGTGHAMRVHATPVKFTLPWLLNSGGVAAAGLPDPEPQHLHQHEGAPTGQSWLKPNATISNIYIPARDSVLYKNFLL